jgi:hypothetical protein
MAFAAMKSAALALQFSTRYFADTVIYGHAPVLTEAGLTVEGEAGGDVYAETGSGGSIPAIIDYAQAPDDEPGTTVEYAEIIVRKSDVALPEYRDPVVIGSTTWLVRRIAVGDDETWTLTLFKAEGPQL